MDTEDGKTHPNRRSTRRWFKTGWLYSILLKCVACCSPLFFLLTNIFELDSGFCSLRSCTSLLRFFCSMALFFVLYQIARCNSILCECFVVFFFLGLQTLTIEPNQWFPCSTGRSIHRTHTDSHDTHISIGISVGIGIEHYPANDINLSIAKHIIMGAREKRTKTYRANYNRTDMACFSITSAWKEEYEMADVEENDAVEIVRRQVFLL